jgi:hypothetical protein
LEQYLTAANYLHFLMNQLSLFNGGHASEDKAEEVFFAQ